jgi:hypothetical protein
MGEKLAIAMHKHIKKTIWKKDRLKWNWNHQ